MQVEALMERVEELTKDKVRLVEEYEAKLGKAQECYERELEAMRRTHQLTTENLLAWKRTEVRWDELNEMIFLIYCCIHDVWLLKPHLYFHGCNEKSDCSVWRGDGLPNYL